MAQIQKMQKHIRFFFPILPAHSLDWMAFQSSRLCWFQASPSSDWSYSDILSRIVLVGSIFAASQPRLTKTGNDTILPSARMTD